MKTGKKIRKNNHLCSTLIRRGGVLLLLLITLSSCRQVIWVPLPSKPSHETTPDTWNGTADTSWYSESRNTYTLDTAEELAGLARLVNNGTDDFSGKTIRLNRSVDISGTPWTPIGANGTPFRGTFDGRGNSIIGFENDGIGTIRDDGSVTNRYFTAFFSGVDGGTVRDIVFENYTINKIGEIEEDPNQRMTSVAVGNLMNGGTVQNVIVMEGTVNGPVRVSGVVARSVGGTATNPNRIIGCENYADVNTDYIGSSHDSSPTYGTAGGILSTSSGEYVMISDSENHGNIRGMVAGGIVGDLQTADTDIEGCSNSGNVQGAIFAGGIVGDFWQHGGTISDCHNLEGSVIESSESYSTSNTSEYNNVNIGGIAGAVVNNTLSVMDCTNAGVVRNDIDGVLASLGGIVGTAVGSINIDNSVSTGEIINTAEPYEVKNNHKNRFMIGGVIGYFYAKAGSVDFIVTDSYGIVSNFDNKNGYYFFGNVAGGFRAYGSGNEFEISFTNHMEFERIAGIIDAGSYASELGNITTYRISNADIEYLDFAGDRQTINIYLDNSNVINLRQLFTKDIGINWGDGGTANIYGGDIRNVIVYPEGDFGVTANLSSDVNLIFHDDDGFSWELPCYTAFANGTNQVYINNNKLSATSGSWSPSGGVVNN